MTDSDDIKFKLRKFPPRQVAALALRAAMRVLPVLATRAKTGNHPFPYWPSADRSAHVLSILRCYQISIFGDNLPEIDSATIATYRAATAVATPSEPTIAAAVRAANAAALATARAATADTRAANTTAFTAALTSIRAARAAAHALGADAALDYDLALMRRNGDIRGLLNQPLWPDNLPAKVEKMWLQLIADLRSLHDYYDVWIVWYQERLEGRPMYPALEKRWASLPDHVRHREPAVINTYLTRLWGDFSHLLGNDEPDETPPENPEHEEPGFPHPQTADYDAEPLPTDLLPHIYASQEMPPDFPEDQEPEFPYPPDEDYAIEPQRSSLASPDEATEIASMRSVLIKAIDNLVSMTSASNELPWVSDIANDYRHAIMADRLSIDDIFGYGVWLKNAHDDIKALMATSNQPNPMPGAMAAINTILAIHDAMIASTARGQDLVARAHDFAEKQAEAAAYRLKAQELAAIVDLALGAGAKDVHDEIEQANDNLASNPQQEKT